MCNVVMHVLRGGLELPRRRALSVRPLPARRLDAGERSPCTVSERRRRGVPATALDRAPRAFPSPRLQRHAS